MRNDELLHYNVKGTNWYRHKFGNWERHAKYANGQPNPETAGSKGPYSSAAARDARMAKKDRKMGARDAKRDLAIDVLSNRKLYNWKQQNYADDKLGGFSNSLKGSLVTSLALGAGLYLSKGYINPYTFANVAPLATGVAAGVGGSAYSIYKKNKYIKDRNERYRGSTDYFNRELSESNIKRLGLSKDYVDSYSKTMDEALKVYDKLGNKAKTENKIKYAGQKPSTDKQAARDRKHGELDAKNDTAIQILDKGEKRTIDEVYKANHQLSFPNNLAGKPGKLALSIPLFVMSGSIYDYGKGQAIKGYNKRYNEDATFFNLGSKKRVIANNSKEFNTHLSKSKIKELGLSKDYVDAYSKAMNSAIKEYDTLRKTGRNKNAYSPLLS